MAGFPRVSHIYVPLLNSFFASTESKLAKPPISPLMVQSFLIISLSLSFLVFSSVNFAYSLEKLAFMWVTKLVVLYDFVVSPSQETNSLHVLQIAYLVSSEIE